MAYRVGSCKGCKQRREALEKLANAAKRELAKRWLRKQKDVKNGD